MPLMDEASRFLDLYRAQADQHLKRLFATRHAIHKALPFGGGSYFEHSEEYVLRGGKRFRGAMLLLGYEAAGGAGGRENLEAQKASLCVELLHAALLVHDDMMDRDETRRGGRALHLLAREQAEAAAYSEAQHVGDSVAVLLAMSLQALAYESLSQADFAPERVLAAVQRLNQVLEGVVRGQLLDVCAAFAGRSTRADIALIEQLKTGLYTTEGPLEIGALLAGAQPKSDLYQTLLAYARPLGEAFQIIDDVLGTLGEMRETGKAAGDLREGKQTLLLEEALSRCEGEERKLIESAVGVEVNEEDFSQILALIRRCGAEEAVREKAAALVDQALTALKSAAIPDVSRETLTQLAYLVLHRRS